ncbi:MAG: hypothetical protein ABW128_21830 [Rhizorhabdus sp.]
MANLGNLIVNLTLESQNFMRNMQAAAKQTAASTTAIQNQIGKVGGFAKGAIGGLAAAFSIDMFASAVKGAFDYADAIVDLADRTGATTKSIQEMRYAAQMTGSDYATADAAIEKFAKNLGNAQSGNKALQDSFKALGVDISGDFDSAVRDTIEGISKLDSTQKQTAAGQELFGKSAGTLTVMLSGGKDGLDEMAKAAAGLGLVIEDNLLRNAGQVNDKLDTMSQIVTAQLASSIIQNADAIGQMADQAIRLTTALLNMNAAAANSGNLSILDNPNLTNFSSRLMGNDPATVAANARKGLLANVDGRKLLKDRNTADLSAIDRGDTYGANTPAMAAVRKAERTRLLRERREILAADRAAQAGPVSGKPKPVSVVAPPSKPEKPKGKSAAELAREAFQDKMGWQNEWLSGESEYLGLRERLLPNINDKRDMQLQQAGNDNQRRVNSINADGPLGSQRYDQNQLDILLDQEKSIAAGKAQLINLEAEEALSRERLTLQSSSLANDLDLLDGAKGLARTQAERRRIGLQILDASYAQQKLALDAVVASKTSTDAEKQIAQARLNVLDKLKGQDRVGLERSTMGPLASYLDGMPSSLAEINEAVEHVAIDGFGSLNDGIMAALTGTGKLTDAFGNMVSGVLSGLAEIALQQAVIKPLAGLLLGSGEGGGGGLGGLLGGALKSVGTSLFGAPKISGARANGGLTRAGSYLMGERGPEIVNVGNTANVIPNHALQNIRSANDNMTINVDARGSTDPAAVRQQVAESILALRPMLNESAAQHTMKKLNRPRL